MGNQRLLPLVALMTLVSCLGMEHPQTASGKTVKPTAQKTPHKTHIPLLEVKQPEPPPRVKFDRDIAPIFVSRCQPCHFAGGKMYDRLPFDQAATIRTLGSALFSRIKDKDERARIQAFLDAGPQPAANPVPQAVMP